jgi:hypothetical protein
VEMRIVSLRSASALVCVVPAVCWSAFLSSAPSQQYEGSVWLELLPSEPRLFLLFSQVVDRGCSYSFPAVGSLRSLDLFANAFIP